MVYDFHSTRSNLFYTQIPSDNPQKPDFATLWLQRSRSRLPDFPFSREPRKLTELTTSKNYFFRNYEIPAITYELGDETDHEEIERASRVFAQETMQILLEKQ